MNTAWVMSGKPDRTRRRARWGADGGTILFVSQNEAGHIGVHVQDFVPGADTFGTRRELVGFTNDSAIESLGLSPDGRFLAVSAAFQRLSLKQASSVGLQAWPER